MQPWEEVDFVHTPNSIMTERVLSLAAEDQDGPFISGSAIIVSRYLAATAKHVIDDYFKRIERELPADGHHASFGVVAVQVFDGGGGGALWAVDKIWMAPSTDIAFLRLRPASDSATSYEWRGRLLMNALPPAIGARVAAFGYHSGKARVSEADGQIEWYDRPTSTYGTVCQVFPVSRDRVQMPFPCFAFNARVDGGMSGGPVFNPSGELCGILLSSFPATHGDDSHTSYAASLWPALATSLEMAVKERPESKTRTALDLAAFDALSVANWDRVGLTQDSADTKLSTARSFSHSFLAPGPVSCSIKSLWRKAMLPSD